MNYRRNFLKQCAGFLSGLSIFPFLSKNKVEASDIKFPKSNDKWGNKIIGVTWQSNIDFNMEQGVLSSNANKNVITCYYEDGTSKIVDKYHLIYKGLGSYEIKI